MISYNFNTFPVLIELSKAINEDYNLFLKQFNKTIHVNDYASSHGVYKLSIYMAENLDFSRARKMAALSLRYKSDLNFHKILTSNMEKINWFYYNSEKISTIIHIN
jgi:hypothetical protein